MASYSSILNKEQNNNRSDPSRMNSIDQTRLARLRPEKLDDMAVKQQISVIQQACGDVDPEIIALVFHECDYNLQQTIARIQAGDFADSEWQTAKSNNKKKNHNHNLGDQIANGSTLSDSERSLSQRTSPTSSLRDGNRHYQYSSSTRTNTRRRGNDSARNQFIPANSRYPPRMHSMNKPNPSPGKTTKSSEISSPPKQSNEDVIPQITSSSNDEYQFVEDTTQSLTFDNSQKKIPVQPSSKHRISTTIPQEPVSMHPTVQFSNQPIDIQFGDIQWNDSVPVAVSPSDSELISTVFDNDEQDISSIVNTHDHEQNEDVQDASSSDYINHQTTNEIDNQLSSSLSITDNTLLNNLPIAPPEGTSHLSDQLTDTSSSVSTQYSSQQQALIPIPITRLPPTSTPRAPEYTSPTSQFIPNNLQQTNNGANTSAFTPFNTLGNYQTIPRDYQQTNWNPQSSNYKTASKTTMIPAGTYQQQQPSYQLPPQQQQIFLGTYPYPTLSPTVVQLISPFEHWPTGGFSTPLESYPYATTNYISTYPNQQQYHPQTKYDQHSYDKDFFAHYGQPRLTNNDMSYQQQQQQQPSTPSQSQSSKDNHMGSKLSPTAATFSQGAPLTASPSATALYFNPLAYTVQNYAPSAGGSTAHPDRTLSYSSIDNRDNRNGASYGNTNNRNNYYHPAQQQQQQQQQRAHNTNASNSTWHVQQ